MSGLPALYVTGRGVVSPAGADLVSTWAALERGTPRFAVDDRYGPVGRLGAEAEGAVLALAEERRWRHYDRATLLGLLAARQAYDDAGRPSPAGLAVVMGSSRGATLTLEREHDRFLASAKVATTTSPMTTMGVFAASVSQALGAGGPSLSVSSACSTSLNALGAAAALIAAGMADDALAGGAEASLTPFTLAQLEATSVLARRASVLFPCRPLHPERAGLVPGEGGAALFLTRTPKTVPVARVLGFGAATEAATATGISGDGQALVQAVRRALTQADLVAADVDLIVGHGAGTMKGDAAELAAYRTVFGSSLPPLTFHKWLTGHQLGAAAATSVALACEHLVTGVVPGLPYFEPGMPAGFGDERELKLGHVLVAALGFGGNAAAVVLGKA